MERVEYPPPPEFARAFTTIGVTGTNGKTTTTLYAAAALATLARPVVNITTLAHALDDEDLRLLPEYESFLQTFSLGHARGARFAAIELTSESLASGFMRAWPCKIGVFTNLTHDHLAAHGSPEHYLASKAQLFACLPPDGVAVLNRADEASALLAEIVPAGARTVWYANASRVKIHGPLDFELCDVTPSWRGTRFRVRMSGAELDCEIAAIGEFFAENATAALAGAVAAGVDPALLPQALAHARPAPGRFELIAERPYAVVDYAHTPDALARVLDTARALCTARVILVFGAGGNADRAKRRPMGAAARRADRVIITSDNPRNEDPAQIAADLCAGIGEHPALHVELDRRAAIERALSEAAPDDLVLVAGKGHERHQIISGRVLPFSDRDAIRSALGLSRG